MSYLQVVFCLLVFSIEDTTEFLKHGFQLVSPTRKTLLSLNALRNQSQNQLLEGQELHGDS